MVSTGNKQNTIKKICVIGAGNVASHIAPALDCIAHVCQVCSKHPESALALARQLRDAEAVSVDSLMPDADLYLISVADDAIASVASSTPPFPGIWAHTSGSVPASVFQGLKDCYGVFYPLQTFTKGAAVDMEGVPFFIEGNSEKTAESLFQLARGISDTVEFADSERRKLLHLAAVFACNFANYMWHEADNILKTQGLDISFLRPLLRGTLAKLDLASPREAMTGPARRADYAVMQSQMSMLPPESRELYKLISDRILAEFGHSPIETK